jgi:hypothetical protein
MIQELKAIARKREERTLEELEDTLRIEGSRDPRVFVWHDGVIYEVLVHSAPKNVMSLARLCQLFQVHKAMSFNGNRTIYASRQHEPQTAQAMH